MNFFKNKRYLLWILLFAVALIPYLNGLSGKFCFDDIPLIVNDSFYVDDNSFLDCWKREFWMKGMDQGLYRPLTTFSFWLNTKITGIYSPGFRAVNLLLHALAVFLVLKVGLRLKFGFAVSYLAALLYAVHPLHSEAVVPAFGRAELLCAIFILAGFYYHTLSRRNMLYSLISALCLILACWSKEHGIALLPLCILYDILYRQKNSSFPVKKLFPAYALFLCSLAVVVQIKYSATGTILPAMTNFAPFGDNQLALCEPLTRMASAVKIQGIALVKFFWPQTLSHDYSYAQILPVKTVFDPLSILTLVVFFGLPMLFISAFPHFKRRMIFLVAAYIVCVFPASNFLMITGTIFGERLYYIPSIWLCFFSAAVFLRISQKYRVGIRYALIAIILVLAIGRSWLRCEDWDSQLSISLAGVQTSPLSIKTWNNLAVQLSQDNQFEEAVAACDKAIGIYPDFKRAYYNKSLYLIKLKKFDDAAECLRKLIRLGTANPDIYNKLGAILAERGDLKEAEKLWEQSLHIDKNQPIIRRALETLRQDIENESIQEKDGLK